jgi:hypothetical protein
MRNWIVFGRKRSWPNLRYYPHIFQEELREDTKTSGRAVSAPTQTQVRSFTHEPIYLILIGILIFETSHPNQPTVKSHWWGASHRLRNTALELLIFYALSSQVGRIPDSAHCASIRVISWPCRHPSQLFYCVQQSPFELTEWKFCRRLNFLMSAKATQSVWTFPPDNITLLQSVNTFKPEIRLKSI